MTYLRITLIIAVLLGLLFFLIKDTYIYESISAFFLRIYLFFKTNSILFLLKTYFFKTKSMILGYIAKLTIKKIANLMIVGLLKRYIIDKIIMEHISKNFFKHLKEPFVDTFHHFKDWYKSLGIKKKIVSALLLIFPLSVVSYILYFFGFMSIILDKVLAAQFWKGLLAFFIKMGTTIIVFVKDYIWNSWLAPVIEVILFGWLFSYLEKIPVIGKFLTNLYGNFRFLYVNIKYFIHRKVDRPLKRFLKRNANKLSNKIYTKVKTRQEKDLEMLKKLKEERIEKNILRTKIKIKKRIIKK